MEKKTISFAEAVKKGYTHCGIEGGEYVKQIENLRPEQIESGTFQAADDPYPYQIADDLILALLIEHLEGQDTVADENGELIELAANVDFDLITTAVNQALSTKLFYPLSNVFIVP